MGIFHGLRCWAGACSKIIHGKERFDAKLGASRIAKRQVDVTKERPREKRGLDGKAVKKYGGSLAKTHRRCLADARKERAKA